MHSFDIYHSLQPSSILLPKLPLLCQKCPHSLMQRKNCFIRYIAREKKVRNEGHPDYNFTISGRPLTCSNKGRNLSFTYNNKFEYYDHIRDVVVSATSNRKCDYILRAFKPRDHKLLLRLFTTYLRRQMEYCSQLWSPYRIPLSIA